MLLAAVQMSERAARAQLAEMQSQLAELEAERDKLRGKLQARSDELMTQRAVNQQLMLKKEEVEWQLMAAIAKVSTQGMWQGVWQPSPHVSTSQASEAIAGHAIYRALTHGCAEIHFVSWPVLLL